MRRRICAAIIVRYCLIFSAKLPKSFHIFKPHADSGQIILNAFKFKRQKSVISCSFQYSEALIYFRFSVSYDCASQIISGACSEPTVSRKRLCPGFIEKVLSMNMERIRYEFGDRKRRIFVCTHKISEIEKNSEIAVCHAVDKCFDSVGVL